MCIAHLECGLKPIISKRDINSIAAGLPDKRER